MARYIYRTLSRDGLRDLIRQATGITLHNPGDYRSRWDWNKGVPAWGSPGAPATLTAPLELEVATEEEFAQLKALILETKEG
jgi:hypothetical protein